jgi:hypothetical protein
VTFLINIYAPKPFLIPLSADRHIQGDSIFAFYVHGSVHLESMSVIDQQDATSFSFYALQTALHVSGDTCTHHQERELTVITVSGTDRTVCYLPLSLRNQNATCCNYSLLVLLMMGDGITRNM